MKVAQHGLDADKVDEIMEEMEEQSALADQISAAISRPTESLYDDVSMFIVTFTRRLLICKMPLG